MKTQTVDILYAFALHEGLKFADVKRIFKTQSKKDRNIQLKEMEKVIGLKMPQENHQAQLANLAVNDIERSILESSKTSEKDKG